MAFIDLEELKQDAEDEGIVPHPLKDVLSASKKAAYIKGIVFAGFVDDDKLQNDEEKFSRARALSLDMSEAEFKEALADVKALPEEGRSAFLKEVLGEFKDDRAASFYFVSDLALAMASDGDLTPGAVSFLESVYSLLKLSPLDIKFLSDYRVFLAPGRMAEAGELLHKATQDKFDLPDGFVRFFTPELNPISLKGGECDLHELRICSGKFELDDELIIPKTTELILKDAEILFGPKGRLTISGNQVVIERCVFSVKAECTRSDFDEFVLGLDLNNLVFKMCEFNGNMIRSSIGNNGGNITIENSRFVEMKNMKCPGIVYARRSSSSILGMNSSGSVICMDSSFVRCSCVKNDGIIPVMLCAAADMRVEKSVFIDCQVCSEFFYYCGYNNKFIADKLKFVNSFSSNLLVDAERSKSYGTFSFGLHCFKATKFNNVTCVWRYLGTYHLDEKNYPEDEFDKLLSGESGKE